MQLEAAVDIDPETSETVEDQMQRDASQFIAKETQTNPTFSKMLRHKRQNLSICLYKQKSNLSLGITLTLMTDYQV